MQMVEEGANIIDIGGESTRPLASRVTAAEQKRRVLDTIRGLRERLPGDFPISIDTTLSEVAREALDCGANILTRP
jgi:dihydropteroate synthase